MLLQAENLSVTAMLGGRPMPVLRDLSFSLAAGKVLGLVGESGAGKSMIGRAIAQDLPMGFRVAGGNLRYRGTELVGVAAQLRLRMLGRDIAFIPQEPMAALNPVLTVWQQMDEHLRRLGERNATLRRKRACDLLEQMGLAEPDSVLARYAHQLSGGMCQRVLIAMAFAGEPRLVIADEPTTALDVTVQARIIGLIGELQARSGTGVLFITHDLRLAAQICDDIMVLYAGRPAEIGEARRLFRAPSHPYTASLHLAAPGMTGPRQALLALPHQMPGLQQIATLPGCRFALRCPVALPECSGREPPPPDRIQTASCWYPERATLIDTGAAIPVPTAADDAAEILRTIGLRKVFRQPGRLFGRGHETVAVAGADIVIRTGEFVGLVGESGSGKSTVARLVAGLEQAESGRILLQGQSDVPRSERRSLVQMVFQDPQSALNPRHQVADIITQAMLVGRPAPRQARMSRALELLRQVGLPPDVAGRTPQQLSGGQRQRVNIARALCIVPKLLVADEIVSGLDVSVQAQLLDLLLELRERLGFAMLFISHDLAVVRYLCARVMVMHRGVIVEEGVTRDMFEAPKHDYTRLLLQSVPEAEVQPSE